MSASSSISPMAYFYNAVLSWHSENKPKIEKFENSGENWRGWETWAQLEIWYYCKTKYSANFNIKREECIYINGKNRVDFVVTGITPGTFGNFYIELKCGYYSLMAATLLDANKLAYASPHNYNPKTDSLYTISITSNNVSYNQVYFNPQATKGFVTLAK